MKIYRYTGIIVVMALLILCFAQAMAGEVEVRIKDLTTVQGNNENQLVGYGLVTGLKGTGDRSKILSSQMIANMLNTMGMSMPERDIQRMQTKNVAVVTVTGNLPASCKSGDSIDVTVSSMADATSLEGGVLLLTVLKGPDGKVYGSAQGPLSVGSEGIRGRRAAGGDKKLVGLIPDGGIISKTLDADIVRDGKVTLVLRAPDFATVTRIARAINKRYPGMATAVSDAFVELNVGEETVDSNSLVARIGELTVVPDSVAKVIVNERTGTVIMGSNVKILPVTMSHGNITLNVSGSKKQAMGPAVPDSDGGRRLVSIGGDATVKDVVDVLNYMDMPPKDLITVLQGMKQAGALQADLEIQ